MAVSRPFSANGSRLPPVAICLKMASRRPFCSPRWLKEESLKPEETEEPSVIQRMHKAQDGEVMMIIMKKNNSHHNSTGGGWRMISLQEALPSLEEGLLPQPSVDDLACILQKCRKDRDLSHALRLHAYLVKSGLEAHRSLGNYLVSMLVEVGNMRDAQQVFDRLVCRNEWSWNSLITGYIKCGEPQHAFTLYQKMRENSSVRPNGHTFVALLKACTKLKDLERGLKIHAEVARTGLLVRDLFISSALLDMYLKCGSLAKARELFDELQLRDIISWTALIAGYAKHGHGEEALNCFERMQLEGVTPDAITYICILKACGSIGAIEKGREIHGEIERKGLLERDLVVGTALVDMYAKCGLLGKAQQVFDKLPLQTVVSWNALIAGYAKHGHGDKALKCFEEMQLKRVSPDAVTFICTLKACGSIGAIDEGQEIHAEIESKGLLDRDLIVGTALVDMYAKCGCLAKAQQLFDKLPVRNIVSWNALIAGYAEHGCGKEALNCFEKMQCEGVSPDAITFACSLKACGSVGATDKGQEIHYEIARKGLLEKDIVVGNTLVDMYAKCGLLAIAQEVFDKLPVRNVVSWNALIAGYAEHGRGKEALNCYEKMQFEGVPPDAVTLVCSLKACVSIGAANKGGELHAEIARKGLLEKDIDAGNTLVDMYAKFGWLAKAQQVFDMLPVRDIVSWNAIIAGYAKHGHGEEALKCFEQMQLEGVFPDVVTFVCSLKACGSTGASDKGREIHAKIERKGFLERDLLVGTALFDMYAKCGLLAKAQQVFDKLPVRDTASWNALITGYAEHRRGEEALNFFEQMQLEGVFPNAVTLVCSLKACGSIGATRKGLEIHAEIARKGLLGRDLVGNTLVDMYGKCGSLAKAQEVFDKLLIRDVVSWTALIAGYAEHGHGEEALNCFEEMQLEGVSPNAVTFIFSLKACGSIGATEKGREIHGELERMGLLERDLVVSNALVDMYAKCGSLAIAQQVFDKLPVRGVALYNSLIAGYAQLGESENVFHVFDRMLGEGINPDPVTFVVVLNACSQATLSDKGQMHFEAMSKYYGIVPSLEHHTCMVDLLGRTGQLDKALEMIRKLPFCPDLALWHTVLGACRKWGNVELARQAFEHAVSLDEKDAAAYVLMSNIYASADVQKEKRLTQ